MKRHFLCGIHPEVIPNPIRRQQRALLVLFSAVTYRRDEAPGILANSACNSRSASSQSCKCVPFGRPRLHHFSYARIEIFSCGTFTWLAVGAVGEATTLGMCCPSKKATRKRINRLPFNRLVT